MAAQDAAARRKENQRIANAKYNAKHKDDKAFKAMKKKASKASYDKNREHYIQKAHEYYLKKKALGIASGYTLTEKLGYTKRNAKNREILWAISDEYALGLFLKACAYCTALPKEKQWNGIDRANNGKGYVLGNCIPACGRCNMAKGKMPIQEFVAMCRDVVKVYGMS